MNQMKHFINELELFLNKLKINCMYAKYIIFYDTIMRMNVQITSHFGTSWALTQLLNNFGLCSSTFNSKAVNSVRARLLKEYT